MTKKDIQVLQHQRLHENIGEDVGLEMGAKMVKDYYDRYGENSIHFVGRNILEKMLAQPNCTGINMYKALNSKGEQTYVFVGVDNQGKSILEYSVINDNGTLTKEIGMIANRFLPRDPDEGWFAWG